VRGRSVAHRLDRLVDRGRAGDRERLIRDVAAETELSPAEVRAELAAIEDHARRYGPATIGQFVRRCAEEFRPRGGGAVGGGRPDQQDGGAMTRVAIRLAKVEAAVPKPVIRPAYDLSRLTADQLERMAELRERVDAVGLSGLTDGEVDELAAMSKILVASDPPPESRP